MGILSPVTSALGTIGFVLWDLSLTVCNLVLSHHSTGSLVARQHGGEWPGYIPPKDGDSRCSCPALNAMANHGIISRDGKNIGFVELGQKIQETYNFAPTFCYYVPDFAAKMLNKDRKNDKFDLADLDLHTEEGIEHDASLFRQDAAIQPDQGKPDNELVKRFLASASGKDKDSKSVLTIQDVADGLALRRLECRAANPKFSLNKSHKMFGASNASTCILIFGGLVDDLRSILVEERIPDGWESHRRDRFGLTMAAFNVTVFKVDKSIDESKVAAKHEISIENE